MVSIALFVTTSQAPNHQLIKVQKCGISFLSFPHTHTQYSIVGGGDLNPGCIH